jgi:hypothetical protein
MTTCSSSTFKASDQAVNLQPNAALTLHATPSPGKWQIKDKETKGTPGAFAYVYSSSALETCNPWHENGRLWHAVVNDDFKVQPDAYLVVGEQAEREFAEHEASVAKDNANVKPVYISGVSGAEADAMNGFYEPTQEIMGGRVMYERMPAAAPKGSNSLSFFPRVIAGI